MRMDIIRIAFEICIVRRKNMASGNAYCLLRGVFYGAGIYMFHIAMLFVALCLQLTASYRPGASFWKYQALCGLVVYLLYIPCLCFSGLGAITANQWVATQQSYAEMWTDLVPIATSTWIMLFATLVWEIIFQTCFYFFCQSAFYFTGIIKPQSCWGGSICVFGLRCPCLPLK